MADGEFDPGNFVGEDPEGGGYVVYVGGENQGTYPTQGGAQDAYNTFFPPTAPTGPTGPTTPGAGARPPGPVTNPSVVMAPAVQLALAEIQRGIADRQLTY